MILSKRHNVCSKPVLKRFLLTTFMKLALVVVKHHCLPSTAFSKTKQLVTSLSNIPKLNFVTYSIRCSNSQTKSCSHVNMNSPTSTNEDCVQINESVIVTPFPPPAGSQTKKQSSQKRQSNRSQPQVRENKRKRKLVFNSTSTLSSTSTNKTNVKINNDKQTTSSITNRTQSFGPLWAGTLRDHLSFSVNSSSLLDNDSNNHSTNHNNQHLLPISLPKPHTLILGTHPSVTSLTQRQYYGHPMK